MALANATTAQVLAIAPPQPKPFLKWCGGKRQLLPELRKYIPATFGRYFEPFLGGGALFFDMRARGWAGVATLNDMNAHLVQTYVGVKNDVDAVIDLLHETVYSPEAYAVARAAQHDLDDCPDAYAVAAWFIYINRCGFNGLWRVNKSGQCNVPFGRYDNPTICDEPTLRACSKALARTIIMDTDFEFAVRHAKRGDLVYFDPPYVPVSASANFTSYTTGGFGHVDQLRLRTVFERLRARGVRVILSNADVPLVREMYRGFDVHAVEARRNVNSNAGKRGKVGEVIIC